MKLMFDICGMVFTYMCIVFRTKELYFGKIYVSCKFMEDLHWCQLSL